MSDTGNPEEMVPLFDAPTVKIEVPDTPSGLVEHGLPIPYEQCMDPTNSAIQQSGEPHSGNQENPAAGIAFSGGGIRSAAFCSGALRRMLQQKVSLDVYLSCVSGGGYTGAAFLDWIHWKKCASGSPTRTPPPGEDWYEEFFERMRKNAGYICNWQNPRWALAQSLLFVFILLVTVVILPCLLWLPYSLPVAVAVDFLFGDILRESITCPDPVKTSLTRSSYLIMELYNDCYPSGRRVTLFSVTALSSLLFYIISRCKCCRCCQTYRGQFRLLSTLAGLVFAFTAFPWVAHDFLWPIKAWIKVVILFILLALPFVFPIIRNYAAIFLFLYVYSYIISWKVFKTELFGKVPYSDAVFHVVLTVFAVTWWLFPVLASTHQTCFNVYYRFVNASLEICLIFLCLKQLLVKKPCAINFCWKTFLLNRSSYRPRGSLQFNARFTIVI